MSDNDELPEDPDRDDVPPELLEHDGERVFILDEDGVADGTLCVFPELLQPRRRGPGPGPLHSRRDPDDD